jgi:hypothetical protein
MKPNKIPRLIVAAICFSVLPVGAEAQGTRSEPGGIDKEQADAIISELKQIRQLLEKQQAQLAHLMAPQLQTRLRKECR